MASKPLSARSGGGSATSTAASPKSTRSDPTYWVLSRRRMPPAAGVTGSSGPVALDPPLPLEEEVPPTGFGPAGSSSPHPTIAAADNAPQSVTASRLRIVVSSMAKANGHDRGSYSDSHARRDE